MYLSTWSLIGALARPACILGMGLLYVHSTEAREEREIPFEIPSERADQALTLFAQQAGVSVLFPYDEVSRIDANALHGTYGVGEGLQVLLKGTGLRAKLDRRGQLTVQVEKRTAARDSGTHSEARTARALTGSRRAHRRDALALHATKGHEFDQVTVTGSRVAGDEFTSAQPTTVVSGSTIEDFGIVSLGDAMAELPSNVGSYTPTAKPGGNESYPLNVFNGLNLANLRGLNPAYGSRTLTLVDSRRHVPTNQGDGVDLNMIPTILVDRVEVVTGGASASYGSGALAGVVNILLDHDLEGAKGQIDYGTTQADHRGNAHYAFAWGGKVGAAGRLVAGIEGQDMDSVTDCIDTRDWCAIGAQIRVNSNYASNAEPHYVLKENVREDVNTRGVFPLLGLTFDAAGTNLIPFAVSDSYGVGGDGEPVYLDTTLRSDVSRRVGYSSYSRQFNGFKISVDATLGRVSSYTPEDSIDLSEVLLAPDNYYLERLSSNPCATAHSACLLSKDMSAQIDAANDTRTDLTRVVIGASGEFAHSDWSWDSYYQYGKSSTLQAVYGSRHAQRFDMALDAVDDGSGSPICRVTRDGFEAVYGANSSVDPRLADGCVPIDVFGLDNISPQALAYTHGQILEHTYVQQRMAEFVASGAPFRGFGSGPIKAAVGTSWRDESISNPADSTQPDYLRRDYQSQFGESFAGKVRVGEYFGELDIPITERFDMQVAARHSDYANTAGAGTGVEGRSFRYGIDAWKVNGNWKVVDGLTLRASRSRDVRAPNFRELYYRKIFPAGSAFGFCDNKWTGNVSQGYFTYTGDPCVVDLRGGLQLRPEKADTTTFGFAVAPPSRAYRFAADYYDISISDAITPASAALALDGCYETRDPAFCGQIEGTLFDPTDPARGFSDVTRVTPVAMNLRSYRSKGVDLSGEWVGQLPLGTLTTRLVASHNIEQSIQPTATSTALQNITGVTAHLEGGPDWQPAADWSAEWATTYGIGSLGVTVAARFVSRGKKDATLVGPDDRAYDPAAADSIDDNHVPGYVVWRVGASYSFEFPHDKIQVFGQIGNVFNKAPPLIGNGIAGTNPIFFDTVGRTYEFGLRANF